MKRIISSVLAIITVLSCFTVCIVPAAAAPVGGSTASSVDYTKALEAAFAQAYSSPEEKLKNDPYMELMARLDGYELYCNKYTGEVAYRNIATGQVLTSNPVDFSKIAQQTINYKTNNVITKLLSQVEVSFVDNEGVTKSFFSFVEAANRNQIKIKYMQNGFRVEYIMGRLNTSYLLPGVVLESDFLENVMYIIEEKRYEIEDEFGDDSDAYKTINAAYRKIDAWYTESSYDEETNEAIRKDLATKYPDVYKPGGQKLAYIDEGNLTDRDKVTLENLIKTYCPDFNQDLLDLMHAKTGYVQVNDATPVFRVAIEYVLQPNGNGLSVRLPASSIRFDETRYTLNYIKILQHFGAGDLLHDGYVFYPDGSGALVEFDDFYSGSEGDSGDSTGSSSSFNQSVELSGTVYGEDFAYYDIDTSAKHSETIRMPVFGIVSKDTTVAKPKQNGFVAFLEEGDALADLAVSFGGTEHNYASAYAMFYPRPSDTYNMADAISVADNKEMTIVSDKKYMGFYELRYVMLFDEIDETTLATANPAVPYYHASYVGMADVYRDYLVQKQYISMMTDADVEEQLPLYIESFGSVETTKKILSIPVTVDVPLTSFEDIQSMYNRLKKNGITNVNFKLTGFANGGMNYSYPKKLKWMKAVGGKSGYEDLITLAKSEGFGVYPDFNFSYILGAGGGGISLKRHAARAVDDRYCSQQVYDYVYQEFFSFFDICVSPASILEYVEKFEKKYAAKYETIGISVATLGSDLNSDFNEENSLNREDAKNLMIEAFTSLKNTYGSVMSSGGNIYSVQFLDHLVDVPIDSSNFKYESKTVPFMGMVLHGYVNYAGAAINQSGDGEYQLLKSIENGALLYYMLIYQNSHLLKEDENLNKYFSVRFDIWFNTILDQYETLNDAIGDLQLYNIVDHNFLTGERLPTDHEDAISMREFNEKLSDYLVSESEALIAEKQLELHISRLAYNFLQDASITTLDVLKAKVEFVLGYQLSEAQTELLKNALANRDTAINANDLVIGVAVDEDALIASLTAILGEEPTEEQIEIIKKFAQKMEKQNQGDPEQGIAPADICVDLKVIDGITVTHVTTDSCAMDENYKATDYTDASGRITMVTYSNGSKNVHFVLNYNTYDVVIRLKDANGIATTYTVPAYGFVRIDGDITKN